MEGGEEGGPSEDFIGVTCAALALPNVTIALWSRTVMERTSPNLRNKGSSFFWSRSASGIWRTKIPAFAFGSALRSGRDEPPSAFAGGKRPGGGMRR